MYLSADTLPVLHAFEFHHLCSPFTPIDLARDVPRSILIADSEENLPTWWHHCGREPANGEALIFKPAWVVFHVAMSLTPSKFVFNTLHILWYGVHDHYGAFALASRKGLGTILADKQQSRMVVWWEN